MPLETRSNGQLVVRPRQRRLWTLVGVSVALIAMILIASTIEVIGFGPYATVIRSALLGGCGAALGIGLMLLLDAGPTFVLDDRGISEARSALGVNEIDWSDLERVAITRAWPEQFVVFQLKEQSPEKGSQRRDPRVSVLRLPGSCEELVQLLRSRYGVPTIGMRT